MPLRPFLVSCHSLAGSPEQKCVDRFALLVGVGFDYGFLAQWNAEFDVFDFFFMPFRGRSFLCISWRHVKSPL